MKGWGNDLRLDRVKSGTGKKEAEATQVSVAEVVRGGSWREVSLVGWVGAGGMGGDYTRNIGEWSRLAITAGLRDGHLEEGVSQRLDLRSKVFFVLVVGQTARLDRVGRPGLVLGESREAAT